MFIISNIHYFRRHTQVVGAPAMVACFIIWSPSCGMLNVECEKRILMHNVVRLKERISLFVHFSCIYSLLPTTQAQVVGTPVTVACSICNAKSGIQHDVVGFKEWISLNIMNTCYMKNRKLNSVFVRPLIS